MAFVKLQTRPGPDGTRVVIAWPLGEPEAFCTKDDSAFTDSAHRVIVYGTDRCSLHGISDELCPVGHRMPAECPHERLDPAAPPELPMCAVCGRRGTDMTDRYARSPFAAPPGSAPDEAS